MTYPVPPAHIEAYVRVLGPEGALTFLMAFGGAEIVYHRNPARSQLAKVMGIEAARALGEENDQRGLPRRVPLAKPWCAQALRQKGLSVAEIARRMHASDFSVRRWLKHSHNSRPHDPRQGSLF